MQFFTIKAIVVSPEFPRSRFSIKLLEEVRDCASGTCMDGSKTNIVAITDFRTRNVNWNIVFVQNRKFTYTVHR